VETLHAVFQVSGLSCLPLSGKKAVATGATALPAPLNYDKVTVAPQTASIGVHTSLTGIIESFLQYPEFRACVDPSTRTIPVKLFADGLLATHETKVTAVLVGFLGLIGAPYGSKSFLKLASLFNGSRA